MTWLQLLKHMLKPIFLFLFSCGMFVCHAMVKLPRLISDGMVIQRNIQLNIWGWASPNEKITIRFKDQSYQSSADEKGDWSVPLPAQKAGGPYQMTIHAGNEILIKDILIGDVWLCSGQSNMELMMERLKYKYPEEIAHAANTGIRQFTVPDKYDFLNEHKDVESGDWVAADPHTVLTFSAVGFFFRQRIIYKNTRYPLASSMRHWAALRRKPGSVKRH